MVSRFSPSAIERVPDMGALTPFPQPVEVI